MLRLLRSKRENMKIGQRVSVTGKQGSKEFNDHRGIIVGQDTPIYCIEFDDFIHGHAGIDNKNKEGHCWWVYKDLITLIDWDFSKFNKEFVALLEELANCGWEVEYPIDDSEEFSNFDTLICNIPWLLEKGFGEEVKEETELKPGMILRKVTTNADLLVTKDGMYTLSGWRNPGVWQSKYMKTLEEFNQYCGDNWEIVR